MASLRHPALGRTVDVPDSAVASLMRNGWESARQKRVPRIAAPAVKETTVPQGDDPTPIEED